MNAHGVLLQVRQNWKAGLTVALLAKNEPFLAAASASYIAKAAADELYKKVGVNYNADDLADKIPEVLSRLTNT